MALQWLGLVGAIWLQSINGTNSNFPAYSSQLKHILSISQLQLNNLAVASDAGKLFGWFSGIAAAQLPLWLVLMIGSLLGLIGYGVQYLFLSNQISLSYIHVLFLSVLAGTSICWINTVCYIVAIQNFELDHQIAVGLSTSYLTLSAKIYTDFVAALFPSSPIHRAKAYLLLNSVLPLVVCVLASPIVSDIKIEKSRKMEGGFIVLFFITIATGIFAVISSLGLISKLLSPVIILMGMVVFLLLPLVIPLVEQTMERVQKRCWIRRDRRVHEIDIEEFESGERMENGLIKEGEGSVEILDERECVMSEIGVKLMLKRVEFWLYYFVYLCGATLGLVFMNNLGQIAESRGCYNTSSLVSLSSSFGFFGRLFPSLLDYYLSKSKYMVSRPASIASMMAPMSGAFFLLLNKNNLTLYISTAIIGLSTAAITSISVSTTTELFGKKNFSVNHNILITNIPIGSFLFGDFAALLYRKEADHRGGDYGKCMGVECYRTSFIIWGSLCFIGTLLALVLHRQTKKFYSQSSGDSSK